MCHKFPIDCMLHCGKKAISRDMMEDHMTAQCPKMEVLCPFSPRGCDFKVSYYSSSAKINVLKRRSLWELPT